MSQSTFRQDVLRARIILTGTLVLLSVPPSTAGESPPGNPQRFPVSRTFDGRPCSYRMTLVAERTGYRVYRLTYPSPVVTPVKQNNTIPADYYLPDGVEAGGPRRPAVICLHILNGNYELVRMICEMLASRGVPAIWFKLPYYGERSLPEGQQALEDNPKLFIGALSQATLDVRRTVDVLASRPEVDPRQIGLMGISLGGIVAATSAAKEPRIARAALVLGGGDLDHIIHHARESQSLSRMIRQLPPEQRAEIERAIDDVDPLKHAAMLRARASRGNVLMINAAEDNVIPRPCTEKLAAALGISDKVIWLEGLGHYTAIAALPQALQTTADFFAEDLPPEVKPEVSTSKRGTPQRTVVTLLEQAGSLLVSQPPEGRCHFVDLELAAVLEDGDKIEGRLRLVRGEKHKFSIRVEAPAIGKAAFGQGDYPWMASAEKVVFRGSLGPGGKIRDPLVFADPQHVLKLRMLSGLLTALTLAPDTLGQWVSVEEDKTGDGRPRIRIVRKDREEDHLLLLLKKDAKTPEKVTFDIEDVKGTITFRAWQFGTIAHDSLFEAPDELPAKTVDPADLYRVFSALFNFAMENVQ